LRPELAHRAPASPSIGASPVHIELKAAATANMMTSAPAADGMNSPSTCACASTLHALCGGAGGGGAGGGGGAHRALVRVSRYVVAGHHALAPIGHLGAPHRLCSRRSSRLKLGSPTPFAVLRASDGFILAGREPGLASWRCGPRGGRPLGAVAAVWRHRRHQLHHRYLGIIPVLVEPCSFFRTQQSHDRQVTSRGCVPGKPARGGGSDLPYLLI